MQSDIPVTQMTVTGPVVDVGAAAAKAMSPGKRHRYYVPVQYTAENGVVIDSFIRAMSKPKLQKSINDTHLEITQGCMFANHYDDTGWYVVLRLSYSLR